MDFREAINKRIKVMNYVDGEMLNEMHEISKEIAKCIKNGGKVLSCGNGGSAANAMHITGDIVGRFKIDRKAYAGMTLTVEPCTITAVSNDYAYNDLFARQVEGLGNKGDILIGLSSSGNSTNVIKAVEKSKELGIKTIGILGNNGGKLRQLMDMNISIPDKDSDLCEEFAMTLSHIILEEAESEIYNSSL